MASQEHRVSLRLPFPSISVGRKRGLLFSLAPVQLGQNTRMNFTSTGTWDVLSFALDLTRASVSSSSWLGGWRDAISPTPFLGWHWVDGTNASNLNCGSSGCGVFSSGQPRYSSLSSLARLTLLSSRWEGMSCAIFLKHSTLFFLIRRSHSVSFTRAQGIPKYKIGLGGENCKGRISRCWCVCGARSRLLRYPQRPAQCPCVCLLPA